MNWNVKYLILSLSVATVFCSCATKYHPNSISGGYSDFRVARDSFVVTFYGNDFTSSETVLKYALKRASELTIQNGFSYFSVIDSQDTTKRTLVSSSYTNNQANLKAHSNSASVYGNCSTSTSVSEIVKPSIILNIKCYSEAPGEIESVNAKEFLMYNN